MPTPDAIQKLVETQETFVRWLADIWRTRNLVRALLLADAILLILFNPRLFSPLTNINVPPWYKPVWWGVIAALFIVALIIAVRATPRIKSGSPAERIAIKGLLPFTFNDAETFGRLAREDILHECIVGITSKDFRFGILSGESGAGKTSFLQAGLWPGLLKQGHQCIYVKFTDLDPFESVRREILKFLRTGPDNSDLLELLNTTSQKTSEPIVLLFDQFEQFFFHNKRKSQRKEFIRALTTWYLDNPALPVKILVCLRGDFMDHMIELQKSMRYSLGPQESFRLERFEPQQAATVFQVIGETEGITVDPDFLKELTTVDLASREDGLVSPVDVQLLLWMLIKQPIEMRMLNRVAYQKLGGVEGLMERFLRRTLDARETEVLRHAAIGVLLALTDLERGTRAAALTLEELQTKIKATVKPTQVEEAVGWLERGSIRLITANQRSNTTVYELAHERLIQALRTIAQIEVSEHNHANQILDRRVNEWLGNNCSSSYLLTWRELRLIRKQRPYLSWGRLKQQKEDLVSRSLRRRNRQLVTVSAVVLIAAAILALWLSPWGQAWQMKRDYLALISDVQDPKQLTEFAVALIAIAETHEADRILNRINEPRMRMYALAEFAKAYAKTGDNKTAREFLSKAKTSLDEGDLPYLEWKRARYRVADAYVTIGGLTKDNDLLLQAEAFVSQNEITDGALMWNALAKSHADAGNNRKSIELRTRALDALRKSFEDPGTLSEIAELSSRFGDGPAVINLIDEKLTSLYKVDTEDGSLRQMYETDLLEAYAVVGDTKRAIDGFLKPPRRAGHLYRGSVAMVYARVGEIAKDTNILLKAVEAARQTDTPRIKADELHIVAKAYAKVGNRQKAFELYTEALKTLEMVKENDDSLLSRTAKILSNMAVGCAEAGDSQRAIALLRESAKSAAWITEATWRNESRLNLAIQTATISSLIKNTDVLLQATEMAMEIGEYQTRISALHSIAIAYAKLGSWRRAREIAEHTGLDGGTQAEILSDVLIIWAARKNPSLADEFPRGVAKVTGF